MTTLLGGASGEDWAISLSHSPGLLYHTVSKSALISESSLGILVFASYQLWEGVSSHTESIQTQGMSRADAQGAVAEKTCLHVKGKGECLKKYKVQQKGGAVLNLVKTEPQPSQHHEGAELCRHTNTHTVSLQFLLGKQRVRNLTDF